MSSITAKPLDRLYLEAISDLADAVLAMRRSQSHKRFSEELALRVDEHMEQYQRHVEAQR